MNQPSPERIMQVASGHWASRILASALHYDLFTHLSKEPCDADALAKRANISPRGAQALLDGVLGLGFVVKKGNAYQNGPEADTFLIKGKPTYLGFAGMANFDWMGWNTLNEAVKQGTSQNAMASYEVENLDFWEPLVTAIAPLAFPVAQAAAERLGLEKRGAFHMLDVGGGSGAYSAIWLGKNKEAKSTQLDWPKTNAIAKTFLKPFGVLDRVTFQDGNLLEADFGNAKYDYGIYSHMAHGFAADENIRVLKKFRKALKPGGTLVLADFVLDDNRTGHPMALMFYSNMLHATAAGRTYTEGEYRSWFKEAGFPEVEIQALLPQPVTLVYGR